MAAESGKTETVVKQMRPDAHVVLMCGTTVTDALGKMVQHRQVIVLYTMRCFSRMQPENLWRVCSYMALPMSTMPSFQKLAKELRWGIVVVSLWSSQHAG